MANRCYAYGLNAFLLGSIDAATDTLKASLISSASYTPNYTTDRYYSAISGGAIIAAGVTLTSVTTSGGSLSAANVIWSSVTGTAAAYICIYKSTGTDSTSPLIGLIDTATGLPVTPNGGDITAAWSGGVVFTLRESVREKHGARVWDRIKDWVRSPDAGLWFPAPALKAV